MRKLRPAGAEQQVKVRAEQTEVKISRLLTLGLRSTVKNSAPEIIVRIDGPCAPVCEEWMGA